MVELHVIQHVIHMLFTISMNYLEGMLVPSRRDISSRASNTPRCQGIMTGKIKDMANVLILININQHINTLLYTVNILVIYCIILTYNYKCYNY